MQVEEPGRTESRLRNATGVECAAMKSPTIFDQASITSVSRRRSRKPRRCISFGISSDGDCQRSACSFLSFILSTKLELFITMAF